MNGSMKGSKSAWGWVGTAAYAMASGSLYWYGVVAPDFAYIVAAVGGLIVAGCAVFTVWMLRKVVGRMDRRGSVRGDGT